VTDRLDRQTAEPHLHATRRAVKHKT